MQIFFETVSRFPKSFSILYSFFLKYMSSIVNCTFFIRDQYSLISWGRNKILQIFVVPGSCGVWKNLIPVFAEPLPSRLSYTLDPELSFWSMYLIVFPFCLKIIIARIDWVLPRCQSLGVDDLITSFLTYEIGTIVIILALQIRTSECSLSYQPRISKNRSDSSRIQTWAWSSDFRGSAKYCLCAFICQSVV